MSAVDKLLTGTYTALLGIGVVFLMLFLLVGILTVMDKLGSGDKLKNLLGKFKRKPKETEGGEDVKALDAPKTSGNADPKLVAAITAAVAAYTAESGEAPKAEFFVKSIRKI